MSTVKAIVTTQPGKVDGGAPIFVADGRKELEELAFLLEKILDASAHDLKNGTFILVKHE